MNDADEAIIDIIEAIEEYGSTIQIVTLTKVVPYNPYKGEEYTETIVDTKALISNEATSKVNDNFIANNINSSYDLSIKIYSDIVITKSNKIIFDGNTYEISYVSSKILQDTTLIYELLIRK